jgi:hypothetical protein
MAEFTSPYKIFHIPGWGYTQKNFLNPLGFRKHFSPLALVTGTPPRHVKHLEPWVSLFLVSLSWASHFWETVPNIFSIFLHWRFFQLFYTKMVTKKNTYIVFLDFFFQNFIDFVTSFFNDPFLLTNFINFLLIFFFRLFLFSKQIVSQPPK